MGWCGPAVPLLRSPLGLFEGVHLWTVVAGTKVVCGLLIGTPHTLAAEVGVVSTRPVVDFVTHGDLDALSAHYQAGPVLSA